jgi:hypothetical protein
MLLSSAAVQQPPWHVTWVQQVHLLSHIHPKRNSITTAAV